jgi:membrane-associated protease RseP (regulator of RpoE activity)
MIKATIALIAAGVILTGCAVSNPYAKYYRSGNGAETQASRSVLTPNSVLVEPTLTVTQNPQLALEQARERGYLLIGESSFFGPASVSDSLAKEQAKVIGADYVILAKKSKDRVTEAVPTITPVFTSVSTKYGSAFSNSVVGGTATVGVDRNDYLALYLHKSNKKLRLGIFTDDLTADERKQLGSNKGVKIAVVTTGSPAFDADIFKNDIIVKIQETEIRSNEVMAETMNNLREQKIKITLIRDGKEITKDIQLGAL